MKGDFDVIDLTVWLVCLCLILSVASCVVQDVASAVVAARTAWGE